MRDTSEFADGTEQVKPAAPRPRNNARPRPENATPGSQDQDSRAPRRRPPSQTHGVNTQRPYNTSNEQGGPSSSSSNTPRPAGNQQGNPAGNVTRPAPNQQGNPSSAPNNTRPGPNQHGGTGTPHRNPHPYSNQRGPQQGGMNQSGGSTSQHQPSQRPGGYNNQQGPSQGPRNQPYQRNNSSSNYGGPRPGGNQRSGGPSTQGPRQGQGSYQQRTYNNPTNSVATPPSEIVQPPTPSRYPQRSGPPNHSGNRGSGGAYGNQHGHSRQQSRPSTSPQKPQERRTPAVKEKPTGPISLPAQIVVKDLSDLLETSVTEVIRTLIKHGVFASINQVVDYEKASLVAKDLGFEPSQTDNNKPSAQADRQLSANEIMMATRNDDKTEVIPPVVTIMGHVDHGKTSLLDTIRKTKVAAGEAGGITQHIGAYQVEVHSKKITFLDTPGHEAFTAMRARGAQATHIAIIVVAADDGVMPQTREAIDHAQAAKVPIIIALNKIDKANANPDHVKQQLADIGIIIEEYGGEVVCVPVSARKGIGIDELLEYILLVAEVQDIRANPNKAAIGIIIEAKLEKSSGPTATVLVQQGTLKMGDSIVVGPIAGKVRAMFNDRGKRIQKATPSMPVSIIGLPEVPQAGDRLEAVTEEKIAKQRAQQEAEKRRNETAPLGQVSLDTLYMQMQEGKVKELNVVLKCDVQGSSEAIKNSLSKLGEENLKVRLIHEGIGNVSETDVHLAAASGAIIIGFNVKADGAALREAQKEGVDIRYYNIIYKLIDDIQAALTGMLEPTYREVVEGHAEVVQIFKAGKTTVIAGCRITDGKITRNSQARLMRGTTKAYEGKIASLRRGKDDVREVLTGFECGILLEEFNEIEVGDIIESFAQERVLPGA